MAYYFLIEKPVDPGGPVDHSLKTCSKKTLHFANVFLVSMNNLKLSHHNSR